MHVRPVTKAHPAPAVDFTYLLDAISQVLAIIETAQRVLGK